MSEQDQAPREFEPVEDLAEALKLVKEGAKTLSSTTIWTKNQEHVVNSHMNVFNESTKSFYCWIPKGFDAGKFMDDLAKMKETDCFFSVSLMRANIFFKAKFIDFDQAGFRFALPTKVYKVQRRKDLRFPVPDGLSLKAEFNDPLYPDTRTIKKMLDISAGGCAFLIQDDEIPLYQAGLTLSDFTFSIKNKKIVVQAEIRHIRKTKDETRHPGHVVGVLFKEMRPGDSQHVAGWVFEESRKYFSRFI